MGLTHNCNILSWPRTLAIYLKKLPDTSVGPAQASHAQHNSNSLFFHVDKIPKAPPSTLAQHQKLSGKQPSYLKRTILGVQRNGQSVLQGRRGAIRCRPVIHAQTLEQTRRRQRPPHSPTWNPTARLFVRRRVRATTSGKVRATDPADPHGGGGGDVLKIINAVAVAHWPRMRDGGICPASRRHAIIHLSAKRAWKRCRG